MSILISFSMLRAQLSVVLFGKISTHSDNKNRKNVRSA